MARVVQSHRIGIVERLAVGGRGRQTLATQRDVVCAARGRERQVLMLRLQIQLVQAGVHAVHVRTAARVVVAKELGSLRVARRVHRVHAVVVGAAAGGGGGGPVQDIGEAIERRTAWYLWLCVDASERGVSHGALIVRGIAGRAAAAAAVCAGTAAIVMKAARVVHA